MCQRGCTAGLLALLPGWQWLVMLRVCRLRPLLPAACHARTHACVLTCADTAAPLAAPQPTSDELHRLLLQLPRAVVHHLHWQRAVQLLAQHADGDGGVQQHVAPSGDYQHAPLAALLLE